MNRAAQFFIVRADAKHWSNPEYRSNLLNLVSMGIGGIGVFEGGLEETAQMIADLQEAAGGNLLIGADHEFGLPMRILEGGIAFPRAMALGKTLPGITEHVATCIAREQRALGVHWNWAPVADVNSNPQNPIINTRSFGEDAPVVAAHVQSFVRGLQQSGVMSCLKHFPGHGDTNTDTHIGLATIDKTLSELMECELQPYIEGIDAGADSVMIGHLMCKDIDGAHPASLSEHHVRGLLRNRLKFDGFVVTDALDMGAITTSYSSGKASVLAFIAGCDALLMPENSQEAIAALQQAIDEGEITEERLLESEERWRIVKQRYCKPATGDVIDQSAHAMIALKAADAALKVTGNVELMPLQQHPQIAAFAVVNESEATSATTWFHYLAQATELNIDFGYIDGTIEERDLQGLMEGVEEASVVVFVFFGKAVSHKGALPGYEHVPEIMNKLAADKSRIVVSCGSPYGIADFDADMHMYAYSDSVPSLAASVLRLIGRSPS